MGTGQGIGTANWTRPSALSLSGVDLWLVKVELPILRYRDITVATHVELDGAGESFISKAPKFRGRNFP